MGTGIVSIDLAVAGHEWLSRAVLVVAAVVWLGLGAVLAGRLVRDRARVRLEAGSVASLTGVAATGVLGERLFLLGWPHVGEALLALAFVLWLALVPQVLRRWTTPTVGVSFMLTVSTESLAVLAAALAARERVEWLAVAAFVALVLGVLAYGFVLARFDLRQLVVGAGDHWVSGGALAIATLACARVAEAADVPGAMHGLRGGLGVAALAVWASAVVWLPALVAGEVVYRRVDDDIRRWATVFPVGMYGACSFVVGDVQRMGWLVDAARAWAWVAFAVWLVAFAALLRRGLSAWRAS